MGFILASKSPRRVELLDQIGLKFKCIPAHIEETGMGEKDPTRFAESNAFSKAKKVSKQFPDDIIIGADTIVVYNNTIFEQPETEEEAFSMLRTLSGKNHKVITGISIISINKKIEIISSECTIVHMREISDNEIKKYVNTKEPLDKAGAYGIQGKAVLFVDKINGCYNNVVGLPLALLGKLLKEHSIYLL